MNTRSRSAVLALLLFVSLFAFVHLASAASTTVVISEFRFRGPNGGSDEFIELYNLSASPVAIGGWKINGSNNAGTTSTRVTITAGTVLQPGCHYLVANSSTSGGPYSGPVAPSQTYGSGITDDGGIALLTSSNAIIDQVGLSSGSAYKEGTTLTPLTTNVNRGYARKNNGAQDTDNNASDFVLISPSDPQNGCPGNLSIVAAANPASVAAGGTSVVTVTATPGTNPVSSGIAVTGDLSAIGGNPTQQFYDDGTHGDAVAGDNIFTFTAATSPSSTGGAKLLNFTAGDLQGRSATTSTTITILPPFYAIHTIQGNGDVSPLAGTAVSTTGIVTAVKAVSSSGGFFIQEPDADADNDPATSEGIFVFTGNSTPAGVAVGNLVTVSGTVQEYSPSTDPNSPPDTEIASPTVTLISTGNPLPAPINITSAMMAANGPYDQLERYEGMRVHFDALTAVAPTGGTINETTATATSNGIFYAVITGTPRPFREPGVQLPDPLPAGSPCCVPRFDTNPEHVRVDSDGLAGTAPADVTTGQTFTDVTGVLDFATRAYTLLPSSTMIPSGAPLTYRAVSLPGGSEFTVATSNLQRFYDTVDDPATSDAVLTPAAFANRLTKVSLAIRQVMRSPDILGVEEMEHLDTLQALADKVNSDTVAAGQPNPQYVPYLFEGNDIGGIDVGFLVKSSRVTTLDVTQYGKDTTYINPVTGLPEMLNDRPPLVLHAIASSANNGACAVTVIVNHLRSLSGVDGADGDRIRAKRRAQAEYLANLIQGFQTANPNERIVSVGDYNAFAFSDGYVDSIGTITGAPTPAEQVVLASGDLVEPNLTDLINTLPPAEQYSYTFDGDAQALDHILINHNVTARLEYARNNGDFPEIYRNDPNRPERISDHDMAVAFVSVPAPALTFSAPSAAVYGTSFTATVTMRDELNNVVSGYIGRVHFSSDGAAGLPADYTFTTLDGGSHTFTITPLAAGMHLYAVADVTSSNAASAFVNVDTAPLTVRADDKSASFGLPFPSFTATFTGLAGGDTPGSLPAAIFTPDASVGSTAGAYSIHVSGVTSSNYTITFVDGTLTIGARSTTLTVASAAGQYSDATTLTATVAPASAFGQHADGTVTFSVNGTVAGSASVAADGSANLSLILDRAPGAYAVTADYTSTNANFSGSSGAASLTVTAEDARPTYSGVLFVATQSPASGTATVTLRATVQDISATADAAGDTSPGNIGNATVTFVNRDTNAVIAAGLPVTNVDGAGTTGSAAFDWNIDIGNADSQSFTIGIIVAGDYARNASADDTLITVTKPSTSGVTGGGFLVLRSSAGTLGGDAGSKMPFGFNVKYNNSGTNLQGHSDAIFRSAGHVYQVRGNPISLAGVPSTGRATIVWKAQVRDITNPDLPVTIETNASLEVTVSDNGEPGDNDTAAITLWSRTNTLLFSSNWNGAKSEEQTIGGGNIQVH